MVENAQRTSWSGKYYPMINEKNNQLMQEHEAWKRSLEFYKQENALLKFRLSEMVDQSEGEDFLQTAEYFQNEFLIKDEWMTQLTQRLHFLQGTTYSKAHAEEKSLFLHDELRQQIGQFERNFIQLSDDFNLKVLKSIL